MIRLALALLACLVSVVPVQAEPVDPLIERVYRYLYPTRLPAQRVEVPPAASSAPPQAAPVQPAEEVVPHTVRTGHDKAKPASVVQEQPARAKVKPKPKPKADAGPCLPWYATCYAICRHVESKTTAELKAEAGARKPSLCEQEEGRACIQRDCRHLLSRLPR